MDICQSKKGTYLTSASCTARLSSRASADSLMKKLTDSPERYIMLESSHRRCSEVRPHVVLREGCGGGWRLPEAVAEGKLSFHVTPLLDANVVSLLDVTTTRRRHSPSLTAPRYTCGTLLLKYSQANSGFSQTPKDTATRIWQRVYFVLPPLPTTAVSWKLRNPYQTALAACTTRQNTNS